MKEIFLDSTDETSDWLHRIRNEYELELSNEEAELLADINQELFTILNKEEE